MILTGDDKVKLFVGSTKVKAAYVETTRVYPNAILSVTPSMSFAAAGGEQILQIEVLEDQSWSIGGLPVGWSASASSGTGSASVKIIASNNTTVGGKNSTITVVSGDLSADCTVYQAVGVMVYGTPIVTAFGYPDIPAGGGTVSPNVYAYEQVYTWNGVPGSGGVLTTGGTIYYSNTTGLVSAGSLKTEERKERTLVASMTTRVDMNGVTGQNATCNVYQMENVIRESSCYCSGTTLMCTYKFSSDEDKFVSHANSYDCGYRSTVNFQVEIRNYANLVIDSVACVPAASEMDYIGPEVVHSPTNGQYTLELDKFYMNMVNYDPIPGVVVHVRYSGNYNTSQWSSGENMTAFNPSGSLCYAKFANRNLKRGKIIVEFR